MRMKRRTKSMAENEQVDPKIVKRLKRKIIIKENTNLRTRELSDGAMVAWIKKSIEEEVQCYLNQ